MPTDNQREAKPIRKAFECWARAYFSSLNLTFDEEGNFYPCVTSMNFYNCFVAGAFHASAPAVEAPRDVVERVAKAIAEDAIGRDWPDDFEENSVHDLDQNDVRAYAEAAIAALQPSATQPDVAQLTKHADDTKWLDDMVSDTQRMGFYGDEPQPDNVVESGVRGIRKDVLVILIKNNIDPHEMVNGIVAAMKNQALQVPTDGEEG